MNLPKKIAADNIRQSVVEVRYTSNTHFEILLGKVYDSLDSTYFYINTSGTIEKNNRSIFIGNPALLPNTQFIFFNDVIKIIVQPNVFIFDCLDGYISWQVYELEIKKTLSKIIKCGVVESYNRVGLRYVNQYRNKDLSECIKYNFPTTILGQKPTTYSYKFEFDYANHKAIINLHNQILTVDFAKNPPIQNIDSIIDIDIISDNFRVIFDDIDSLFEQINQAHQIEKEVFFELLNDYFLQSLNPQY